MGCWELLVKAIWFKRNYHSGNDFRKALLLFGVSVGICHAWMRRIQHPSASKSCQSRQVRQGAMQGLQAFCSG